MPTMHDDRLTQQRETLKDFFGGDEREEIPDEL